MSTKYFWNTINFACTANKLYEALTRDTKHSHGTIESSDIFNVFTQSASTNHCWSSLNALAKFECKVWWYGLCFAILFEHFRKVDSDPYRIKVIVDLTTDKRIPVSKLNQIFEHAIDQTQRVGEYAAIRDQFYQVAELPGQCLWF